SRVPIAAGIEAMRTMLRSFNDSLLVWVSARVAAPATVPALCDRLMMSLHGIVTLASTSWAGCKKGRPGASLARSLPDEEGGGRVASLAAAVVEMRDCWHCLSFDWLVSVDEPSYA